MTALAAIFFSGAGEKDDNAFKQMIQSTLGGIWGGFGGFGGRGRRKHSLFVLVFFFFRCGGSPVSRHIDRQLRVKLICTAYLFLVSCG